MRPPRDLLECRHELSVGGLATAGGVGFLGRKHGLTIDHVVAAEIVLADGTLLRVDGHHHPDLLWAVRGAGANFGIVTSFELEAYALRDVVLAQMVYDGANAGALLERWGQLVEQAPRELTSFLYGFSGRRSPPLLRVVSVYAGGDPELAVTALAPMLELGRVLDQQAMLVPYAEVIPASDAAHDAFPGETLIRLSQLKAQYDLDNVFNQNFAIPPARDLNAREAASFAERAA